MYKRGGRGSGQTNALWLWALRLRTRWLSNVSDASDLIPSHEWTQSVCQLLILSFYAFKMLHHMHFPLPIICKQLGNGCCHSGLSKDIFFCDIQSSVEFCCDSWLKSFFRFVKSAFLFCSNSVLYVLCLFWCPFEILLMFVFVLKYTDNHVIA